MVRLLIVGLLIAMLTWTAQTEQPPVPSQQDQYFSGTIDAFEAQKITVTRTVLGKDSATRTFLITPETRVEGTLAVNARVTVRFVSADDGDRAVHILVRASGKK
jgi:hypothetical protein